MTVGIKPQDDDWMVRRDYGPRQVECPECAGTGAVAEGECPACDGQGSVEAESGPAEAVSSS